MQTAWVTVWRRWDAGIVHATEVALFVTGATFTALISLEVVSRFVFDFSVFFINALAIFLLVWFFLLGAGLALRKGAHVGFELLVRSLPERVRGAGVVLADLLVMAFFVEMVWSGLYALPPALKQTESSLGISVFWVMLAFPVGFLLLIYHQVSLMLERRLGLPRERVES